MDLEKVRKEIDITDKMLLELIEKRMSLCNMVAKAKKETGKKIFDEQREISVIEKIKSNSKEEFDNFNAATFKSVMDISKAYQIQNIGKKFKTEYEKADDISYGLSVACLGPLGSYSYEIANKITNDEKIKTFESFDEVFNSIKNNDCEYAVLPIENSTAGTIKEVYTLLTENDFKIIKSFKYKICHCLAAQKNSDIKDISLVMSHEMALSQCKKFLKDFKTKKSQSTAKSACFAKENKGVAAVCSKDCAKRYNLDIIKENIGDNNENFTRFIVISKKGLVTKNANKVSFSMALAHKEGSLCSFLTLVRAFDYNITSLQSVAIPKTDFEFMFFVDMMAKYDDENVLKLFDYLEENCNNFKLYGFYEQL